MESSIRSTCLINVLYMISIFITRSIFYAGKLLYKYFQYQSHLISSRESYENSLPIIFFEHCFSMTVETISLLSKLERTSLLARKTPQDARTFWKTSLSNLTSSPIKGLAVDLADTSGQVQTSYTSNSGDQTKIQNFAKSLNGASRGLVSTVQILLKGQNQC